MARFRCRASGEEGTFIDNGPHDSPPTPRLGQFRFDPNFVIYA